MLRKNNLTICVWIFLVVQCLNDESCSINLKFNCKMTSVRLFSWCLLITTFNYFSNFSFNSSLLFGTFSSISSFSFAKSSSEKYYIQEVNFKNWPSELQRLERWGYDFPVRQRRRVKLINYKGGSGRILRAKLEKSDAKSKKCWKNESERKSS